MGRTVWLVGIAALAIAGCGQGGSAMKIESPAFAPGDAIPEKHTGDGADVSPPLRFSGVPAGAVELAVICDDPDAPSPEPWVHWVIYGIPGGTKELPEGYAGTGGVKEGKNSWRSGRTTGYRGPQPPGGTHRYYFKLYALDTPVDLGPGATKRDLETAMEGHVLAHAELMGTYTAK